MLLHPAGSIQLRVPHHPVDLQRCCVGTLSQMTERSAERCVRQETGWLAGGLLLRVATFRRTTDTFLFISHTMNILLFKFLCKIFLGVRIIKEMPGSVASGTPCRSSTVYFQSTSYLLTCIPATTHCTSIVFTLVFSQDLT